MAGLLPFAQAAAGTAPLTLLQVANVTAFALNCATVSVPGRIDGQQDEDMRRGALNPNKPTATRQSESAPLQEASRPAYDRTYSTSRGRTMVSPSGWAFAIWGPIYLGETLFVASQFFPQMGLESVLPSITAPFVAANLFQSLWCVSFRPAYTDWASYISPCMLAGTAYSLSQINAVATTTTAFTMPWFLMLPMSIHFGWTSAATLVNLSGSIAMKPTNSNRAVTAVGHGSAVMATALGVVLTLVRATPTYGFTLAWALSACADGMNKRGTAMDSNPAESDETLRAAVNVQKNLCWVGAAACAATSAYVLFV